MDRSTPIWNIGSYKEIISNFFHNTVAARKFQETYPLIKQHHKLNHMLLSFAQHYHVTTYGKSIHVTLKCPTRLFFHDYDYINGKANHITLKSEFFFSFLFSILSDATTIENTKTRILTFYSFPQFSEAKQGSKIKGSVFMYN